MGGLDKAADPNAVPRRPGRPPQLPDQENLEAAVYAWPVHLGGLLDRFGNQTQQAAAVGYDQKWISVWRRGKEVPRLGAFNQLCDRAWDGRPVTDEVRVHTKNLYMAALKARHPQLHEKYV